MQEFLVVTLALMTVIAEHYFPWKMILGHELHRVVAYVLGVLAIAIPFLIYVEMRQAEPGWNYGFILIAIILATGLATAGCYLLDAALAGKLRYEAGEENLATLKDYTNEQTDQID